MKHRVFLCAVPGAKSVLASFRYLAQLLCTAKPRLENSQDARHQGSAQDKRLFPDIQRAENTKDFVPSEFLLVDLASRP
jgi:hypothetical protein